MKKTSYWLIALLCVSLLLVPLWQASLLPYRRESAYLACVKQTSDLYGIPGAMVLAVIKTESNFDPNALSHAGAVGLMQLLPETFRYLQQEHFKENLPDNALLDPEVNIRYGCYYLAYLYHRFPCWETTLAAYNAGVCGTSPIRKPRLTWKKP